MKISVIYYNSPTIPLPLRNVLDQSDVMFSNRRRAQRRRLPAAVAERLSLERLLSSRGLSICCERRRRHSRERERERERERQRERRERTTHDRREEKKEENGAGRKREQRKEVKSGDGKETELFPLRRAGNWQREQQDRHCRCRSRRRIEARQGEGRKHSDLDRGPVP
jgi:hypothetical protein